MRIARKLFITLCILCVGFVNIWVMGWSLWAYAVYTFYTWNTTNSINKPSTDSRSISTPQTLKLPYRQNY